MKIEIRNTTKDGLVQITTLDERWYHNQELNIFRPSATWISSYYPKGVQFYKWLASKGWDEAEAIKIAAGSRGSKVHQAIEALLKGNGLRMDDRLPNPDKGELEEFSVEEWEAIISFVDWFNETKPTVLQIETTVENGALNYAGTMDLKCLIDGEVWIVDFKTSGSIWPSMEIQLSSYMHSDGNEDVTKQAILQLGYRLNKKKFKFTEVEDKFHLFLAARQIWEDENKDVTPKQKDYPVSLKLETVKVETIKKEMTQFPTKVVKNNKVIKKGKPTNDNVSKVR